MDNHFPIGVDKRPKIWTLTFNRPEQRNSINAALLDGLNHVLDEVEQDPGCRVLVLSGCDGYFCTGMDFQEAAAGLSAGVSAQAKDALYMNTLRRFSLLPKVVISKVEGVVMAGGIGLVAASDLVVAGKDSQFSLSEALWGLLPACVTPYLIRRVGFQKAYKMTLTTETLAADEAWRIGLVDILSDRPDDEIRRQLLRLSRLEEETIVDLKHYFRKMWLIDDVLEKTAVDELSRLIETPRVVKSIRDYVEHGKFPWDV